MDEIQKVKARENMAKARAAAAANRALRRANSPATEGITEAPVAAARTPLRTNEAVGRNGEILSRKRTQAGDIFDVPAALIPAGWEYQWCGISVTGNTEILLDQNLMFAENGWRPVPASRYEGRYMPAGHKGSIIRGGQMLMERPKVLSDDARAEDVRAAKQLISDRNESLKLSGMKKNMGDGFEMGGKYRGTGGDIRMSIDRALDVPVPTHQLADPEK